MSTMAPSKKRKKSANADDTTSKKLRAEKTTKPVCRLLHLPRELRDVIYEMCLADMPDDHDNVEVFGRRIDWMCMPPLLQTCQQIRLEGMALWLQSEDGWAIGIEDCDATRLLYWTELVAKYSTEKPDDAKRQIAGAYFWIHGDISPANLSQWCRWIHEGKLELFSGVEVDRAGMHNVEDCVVKAAHNVVDKFKGKPWEDCHRVLEILYELVEDIEGHEVEPSVRLV